MKRDKRAWAGVLAAATLWLASVCAGSDDLTAAVNAVRQSGLVRRLVQWELGSLFRPTDTMGLPALLALEQSPQLARARYDVEAARREEPEETPEVLDTEDAPSPAPAATEENGTTPNSDMARTVAVTTEDGYIRVGDVFIKNTSRQTVEDIVFDGTFAAKLGEDAPQVLILHTHATETYQTWDTPVYDPDFTARTKDTTLNMCAVGEAMTKVLNDAGITTLHDTTLHDSPSYTESYARSAQTARRYLEEYPSIKVVLDVHRDAMESGDARVRPLTTLDGQPTAQVMIIAGCNNGGTVQLPNWRLNLCFAAKWEERMEMLYPGLTRPVLCGYRFYNQDVSPGALLIEIGGHANTVQQAVRAGQYAAKALAALFGGSV